MAEWYWMQTEPRDDERKREERNGGAEALADSLESHDVLAVE